MSKQGKVMRMAVALGCAALVLVLATAGDAAAQGRFGFFGGLNIANMGGDADDAGAEFEVELEEEFGGDWSAEKGSKIGLGLGAYYFVPATPTLGLQIEGQYIRRGMKFDISGGGQEVEAAFKLDYVEFPILLRVSPGAGQAAQLVFLVGPVIGFKAGADLAVSGAGLETSVDVGDSFKSTTFGALGGVGVCVEMGETSSFLMQARYYLGLSNALDDDVSSSKAGDFGFFAGLEFALGQ